MYKNIHYLVILVCIYPVWIDSATRIRSFVQGAMPVVTGLIIGQRIGHYLGSERIGALTCASTAAFLDHNLLKGHKDRHAVARKLGNVAPVALALLCYCSRMATSCDQVGKTLSVMDTVDDTSMGMATPDPYYVDLYDKIGYEPKVEPLSPYDTLRAYVFYAQEMQGSLANFYPEQTKASMRALVAYVANVTKQEDGFIKVSIKAIDNRGLVPCLLEQEFARRVMKVYDRILYEQALAKL